MNDTLLVEELQKKSASLHYFISPNSSQSNSTQNGVSSSSTTTDPFAGQSAKLICDDICGLATDLAPSSLQFDLFVSVLCLGESSVLDAINVITKSNTFETCLPPLLEALEVILSKASVASVHSCHRQILRVLTLLIVDRQIKRFKDHSYTAMIAMLELLRTGKYTAESIGLSEILKSCLSQQLDYFKSLSGGNKKGLFHLWGALCKNFPSDIPKKDVQTIINVIMGELRGMESNVKTVELNVFEGCFLGLTGILHHFFDVLDSGKREGISTEKLYALMQSVLNSENEVSRHGAQRAAMVFLTNHAYLFIELIFLEFRKWYGDLMFWTRKSDETKQVALSAVDALLKQISDILPEKLKKKDDTAKEALKFFMHQFHRQFLNEPGTRDSALAVQGYGYFAKAIKVEPYGGVTVERMLKEVCLRTEQIFFGSEEPVEKKISYMIHFLGAFARILEASDTVSSEAWTPLESLQTLFYQHFPILDRKYHHRAGSVSYHLFLVARVHNQTFLDRVLMLTLLKICSRPPENLAEMSSEIGDEGKVGGRRVKMSDYVELFRLLLSPGRYKEINLEYAKEVREELARGIFDSILKALVDIVSKLNFEASKEISDELVSSDPLSGLTPVQQGDFWVFINLVQFLQEMLFQTPPEYFLEWICPLVQNFVELASKNPYVSGFYKLLSLSMQRAKKLHYFEEVSTISDGVSATKLQTYGLCSQFCDEVLSKIVQFKDDLLISCLEFLLSLPAELISSKLDAIANALEVGLRLGLSYLPLADTCLDALEYWTESLYKNSLVNLYRRVLPCLDEYLRTDRQSIDESDKDDQPGARSRAGDLIRKRKLFQRVKLGLHRKFKPTQSGGEKIEHSDKLMAVRKRIVSFLGSIGGEFSVLLINQDMEDLARQCVAWYTTEHLKFVVPFPDLKAEIGLDKFFPRVCELALSSGDRKSKIAACELLYSMIIFTMGTHSAISDKDSDRKKSMSKVYKRIFPVMLRLCCDADEVSRQLFQPLMMQVIHWFSSNKSYENTETVALLGSIMEDLVNPDNAGLRDWSAQCLAEFMQWSIKHSSGQNRTMLYNTESTLKRLYSYASHPSGQKRLGAAVAINAFYRIFREESDLVNVFVFEMLVQFMDSLALADSDEESLGTQSQTGLVLDHLKRIISHYSEKLRKPETGRKLPHSWSEGTLEGCVKWLFEQVGRPEACARRKCFELIEELAPKLKGSPSLASYFNRMLEAQGPEYFVKKFEGGNCKSGGLRKQKVPECWGTSNFHLSDLLKWLSLLEAALDCYTVVVPGSSAWIQKLFRGETGTSVGVFDGVDFFLRQISGKGLDEVASLSSRGKGADLVFTPLERKRYNRARATLVVRILGFCTTLLDAGTSELIPRSFWNENLFLTILDALMDPKGLGFDISDQQTGLLLPQLLKNTLESLKKLQKQTLDACKLTFQKGIDTKYRLLEILRQPEESAGRSLCWVNGVVQLTESHVFRQLYDVDPKEIFAFVCSSCFKESSSENSWMVRDLTPTELEKSEKLIKLAMACGLQASSVCDAVTDATPVSLSLSSTLLTRTEKGKILLEKYGKAISAVFAKHPAGILDELFQNSRSTDSSRKVEIITILCDLVGKDARLRKRLGKHVAECCLSNWKRVKESALHTESKYAVIRFLQKIILINSSVLTSNDDLRSPIFDWFLAMISESAEDLDFKNKALELLGIFTLNLSEPESKRMKETLNNFVANNLPLSSREFPEGSLEQGRYLTALRRLLFAMGISDSPLLLEVILSVLCREKEHAAGEEFGAWLRRYCKRITLGKQDKLLSVTVDVFFAEDSALCSDEMRLNALEKVLIPMLSGLPEGNLAGFYLRYLKKIMEKLEAKLDSVTESAYGTQMVTKIGCFKLVELMYNKLSVDVVKGQINAEYAGGKVTESKTELLKKLVALTKEARNEGRDGTAMKELKLEYRCVAHNCLCAVICRTQKEPKFYDQLIFPKEMFDLIVDKTAHLDFSEDFDELTSKKKLVSLKQTMKERNRNEEEDEFLGSNGSLQFISSQVLAESSLSSEMSQMDYSGVFPESQNQDDDTINETTNESARKGQTRRLASLVEQESRKESELETGVIEMDKLNGHPCMIPMVAVIQHLVDKKMSYDKNGAGELPKWLRVMVDVLDSPYTAINIRIFIARIISLLEKVFEPYAKYFAVPLMKLIVDDEFGKAGLHYFRVDLITTLLSWSVKYSPETMEEKIAVNSLLDYVIKHVAHENSSVLKRNVRLVNVICECWRGKLAVTSSWLMEKITASTQSFSLDKMDKELLALVQVAGVFLRNEIDPLGPRANDGGSRSDFYKALLTLLGHKKTQVYRPVAEILGLGLNFLKSQIGENVAPLEKQVQLKIDSVYRRKSSSGTEDGTTSFLRIVHDIQLHYPSIALADNTVRRMLSLLSKLHGSFKLMVLEVCLGIAASSPEDFTLRNLWRVYRLSDCINSRDDEQQELCLRLLGRLMRWDKTSSSDILDVMKSAASFVNHSYTPCRQALVDLSMRVYDRLGEGRSVEDSQLRQLTKECLLKALTDKDPALRQKVSNFWSHDSRLKSDTSARLLSLMELTYSPANEAQFLAYASYLLLEKCAKSPDFSRNLFNGPLKACKFENLSVITDWKRRHSTLQTPLFAASQSQMGTFSSTQALIGETGELRATQAVQQFSQTQKGAGLGGGGSYTDWLTGNTFEDTYADDLTNETSTLDPNSSLLFAPSKRVKKLPSYQKRKLGTGLSGQQIEVTDDNRSETMEELSRLRRRVLKDKQAERFFYARMQTRQKLEKDIRSKERNEARGQRVSLFRKYRYGDYPDVEIPYSALIAPLQALAQCDTTVAGLLFESLLGGIFDQILQNRNENLGTNLTKILIEILQKSESTSKPLITAILTFVFNHIETLQLNDDFMLEVANTGISSGQELLAIAVLEQYTDFQASQKELEPPREKRSRKKLEDTKDEDKDDPVGSVWVDLSRLYKSLGDYGSVRAIFGDKLKCSPLTVCGLEAEERQDYELAKECYIPAMKTLDAMDLNDAQNAELDLLEESRIKCVEQLGDWSTAVAIVRQQIINDGGSLEAVWTNAEVRERNLEDFVRGNFKMIIADEAGSNEKQLMEWLSQSERKSFLESRFPGMMAVLQLKGGRIEEARYLTDLWTQSYLEDWTQLDPVAKTVRMKEIQVSNIIEELQETIEFCSDQTRFSDLSYFGALLRKWSLRAADTAVSQSIRWDDLISQRLFLAEQIASRYISGKKFGEDVVFKEFMPFAVRMRLLHAKSSCSMKNFSVAAKQLHAVREVIQTPSESISRDLHLEWCLTYAKLQQEAASELGKSPQAIEKLVSGLKLSKDNMKEFQSDPEFGSAETSLVETMGVSFYQLGKLCLSEQLNWEVVNQATKQYLLIEAGIGKTKDLNTEELGASLLNKAHELLSGGKGGLALSEYCDSVLRMKEDDNVKLAGVDTRRYPETVVSCTLNLMSQGSKEARTMFPRILSILESHYDSVAESFIENCSEVPCWMFLGWLPQLLSLLPISAGGAVHNILLRVAKDYPKALVYPLKLSMSTIGTQEVNAQLNGFLKELEGLISSPLIDDLIEALHTLQPPVIACKDLVSDVNGELKHSSLPETRKRQIAFDAVEELEQLLFPLAQNEKRNGALMKGALWSDTCHRYSKYFYELFGENLSKASKMESENLLKNFGNFYAKFSAEKEFKVPPGTLKKYSPWLYNFNCLHLEGSLELPGQYTGEEHPNPDYHVQMVGFNREVVIMSSIRKPKVITIRGNDGKEYPFLVKSGEDLRQDQRIEQLFGQMNSILASDGCSRRRELRIKTYKVVPMTSKIGMIEFLPNVVAVKEFLMTAEEHKKITNKVFGLLSELEIENVLSNPKAAYMNSYLTVPLSTAEGWLKKIESFVKPDLITRGLVKMSVGPQGFVTLRTQFLRSLAVMSVAHYLLGIGDRHLNNLLLDYSSATVVGIDFGHAFGSGTQLIAVPELVPFRLTRQFASLADPVGLKGPFRGCMVAALRALREEKHLLLNTMEVFVKEPSVDWQSNAKKQLKHGVLPGEELQDGSRENSTLELWYPNQKLEIARMKLRGDNPVTIMSLELKQARSRERDFAFDVVEAVLYGKGPKDLSAEDKQKPRGLAREALVPEDQVTCLIDFATDKKVMSRMWLGWDPWI